MHKRDPLVGQLVDQFVGLFGMRSVIMGILNVTPDSFSDGGKFQSRDAALAQARKLVADGADVIDVGAESTRPGHTPVPEDVELSRLAPILPDLVQAIDKPISVDTSKAAVARYAISVGAAVVNDVWGLQKDPAMADTVAEGGAAVVIMHNRDGIDPELDVLSDMRRFFDHSLALADKAGIARRHIMLDPGIGFRQDEGSESFRPQSARAFSRLRLTAARRRLAQILARGHGRRRGRIPFRRDACGQSYCRRARGLHLSCS